MPRGAHETSGVVARPSTTCSISSRNVGSAQWTSSKSTRSGRSRRAPRAACGHPRRAPPPGTAPARGRSPRPRDRARHLGITRQRGELRERLVGRVSSLDDPRRLRTTSASGQKVMPSPYGRQRPRRTTPSRRATHELVDQARLPDARLADDRHEPARPRRDGLAARASCSSSSSRRPSASRAAVGARRRRAPRRGGRRARARPFP